MNEQKQSAFWNVLKGNKSFDSLEVLSSRSRSKYFSIFAWINYQEPLDGTKPNLFVWIFFFLVWMLITCELFIFRRFHCFLSLNLYTYLLLGGMSIAETKCSNIYYFYIFSVVSKYFSYLSGLLGDYCASCVLSFSFLFYLFDIFRVDNFLTPIIRGHRMKSNVH